MGMLVETKATKLYKLRLVIFSVLYFLLAEAIGLLSFIYLFPADADYSELNNIQFDCVIEDCEYKVTKIYDIKDYNNNDGKKVVFTYSYGSLIEKLYEDYAEVKEGLIYQGTIVVYKATFRGEIISAIYTPVFYYEPVADNPLTFDDFKREVKEKVKENLSEEAASRYRMTIAVYMLIFSTLVLLLLWVRFKISYATYTRKLSMAKFQMIMEKEVDKNDL